MGLVSFVMDWSDKTKIKAQLLAGLDFTRGPGRGLDIPRSTLPDADLAPHIQPGEAPEAARHRLTLAEKALEELVRERRDLVVGKFRKHLTLYYRQDFKAAVTAELEAKLDRDGFFGRAGESLTVGGKDPA